MVEITWQDPPPARGAATGGRYEQIIEALRKHPGRWALITSDWKTSSAPAAFRQNGCQATTRANEGKKTYSVYARFPTPKESQPAAAAPSAASPAPKTKVEKAIATGTALKPPPAAAPPKRPSTPAPPANDFGMAKFRADRAARGART
ncbi:hypothetical protein SEA_ELESAR_45 [Arthrobacter phage Elesar]|uniref:Uncharacterized protein n=1 Tax=Arthrobacter phage Elesar TaxID=2510522 RepID=A0A411CQL8_9CAUD|nr:hypothetical protein QEO79_gp51 [Arthrobacter phage Elesar]QAY16096.1 hypothetical protein SEA_ELESAR_45 [Arthrobacter phage Elesar]